MDADLTINSIAFKKSFDEKDGSERRSTSRGVNTPDVMAIKRQDAVDSQTKVAGKRYLMRFDRWNVDGNGQKYNTSAYIVISVPELAATADVDAIVATIRAAVASSAPDLVAGVLNSES